jgi:CRP/FNR family cyclic AMP-dependent transcriptional regulator
MRPVPLSASSNQRDHPSGAPEAGRPPRHRRDRRPLVFLLDADPGLGAGLGPGEITLARRALTARMETIAPGHEAALGEPRGRMALVLLAGLLLREVTLARRTVAELLGGGDVVRPWAVADASTVGSDVRWTVVEPVRAAVVDARFVVTAARRPTVLETLLARAVSRAHAATMRRASMRLLRLDDRILVALWSMADRWGHVRPDGVMLRVPLTHELLARLVGAGRPAVTRALGRLRRRRLVRRDAGAWILETSGEDWISELL